MHNQFYTPFLETSSSPSVNLGQDKNSILKYLYISTLSRILTSLNLEDRKAFLSALLTSEKTASEWIRTQPEIKQLVKEHIQRTMLSLNL